MIARGKSHRSSRAFINNRLVGSVIAARLRPMLLKKTRGHYPAVLKALDVVTRGISRSIPESLALERDAILELVQTEACRNLIGIFFLQERAKKRILDVGAFRTDFVRKGKPLAEPKPIARTAVIGAGVMGAGIAQWLSARQLPVILRDLNTEHVAKGMASIAKIYRDGAKRHVFTATRSSRMGSIASTRLPPKCRCTTWTSSSKPRSRSWI